MALGLGAEVTILDRSIPRLRQLNDIFGSRINTQYSTKDAIDSLVVESDLVVGAVLIAGAAAPKLANLGAAAPAIKTAPTTKSDSTTNESIASLVEYWVFIRLPKISLSCLNLGIERSSIVTSAPKPSAISAACVPETPPPITST